MKKIYFTYFLVLLNAVAFSQGSLEQVIAEVEKNNTTLAAYRLHIDAEKTGNKTGLLPSDPELEFNYLIGKPDILGDRKDIAVTQSFDFPTSYIYKSQISNLKNQQAELEYKKQRYAVLLQTRLLCSELTYINALHKEYKRRLVYDNKIANAYKRKMELGEATILEYNNAQLSLLNTEKKLEKINIQQDALIQKLTGLNGGNTIQFTDSIFVYELVESNFDLWYANAEKENPILNWLKHEVNIAQKEKKLTNAQSLPKFNVGYMSEKVMDEQFQGITMGITIPLWENKNTIKYAKLKTEAIQSMANDSKLQFYNEMKTLHSQAIALQNSIADYKKGLSEYSNVEMLKKALDKSEISLAEYYYEQKVLYENIEELLLMEKQLQDSIAMLNQFNY